MLLLLFLAAIGVAYTAGTFVLEAYQDLPPLSSIEPTPSVTSFLYDAQGKVLANLHAEENRIPVRLSKMPVYLRHAAIAIEDHQFYEHKGIDLRGLARAVYVNLTGKAFHGGSTITQQLAKNAFLTNETTYKRKVQDMILAIQLERMYTKDEILEMYLNQIPFGNGAYGVEAASQLYFGKSVEHVSLLESAMLMGITNAPSVYDPYRNLDACLDRARLVLSEMLRIGMITAEEYQAALEQPLEIVEKKSTAQGLAGHFVDYVLTYLLDKYGRDAVYNGGLQVYTTIDSNMQAAAEKAIADTLDPIFPVSEERPYPEAAAIIVDPNTGHIKAMVGGRTHVRRLELNRVIQSKRQPGSAFKPLIVYGAALEAGITPGTVIDDIPVEYPQLDGSVWKPTNYDHLFHGLVTIREALVHSYNIPAVRVLEQIGVRTGVEFAERVGIRGLITSTSVPMNDLNLSVALGGLTDGVTPLEMAAAFSVFASGGIRSEPIAILRVVDKDGNVLEDNRSRRELVISETTAYLMTSMLEDVIRRGTGTRASIGRPAAGKTGTTNDYRDAWFAGYTPDLVGIVWMGFDKDLTMREWRITGGSYPATIWSSMMSEAHKGIPVRDFVPPSNLVRVEICPKSGKLVGDWCPAIVSEIYVKGTEPREECDVHVPALVCAEHPDRLASPFCPEVVYRSFIKRPIPFETDDPRLMPIDAQFELPELICEEHQPEERSWSPRSLFQGD